MTTGTAPSLVPRCSSRRRVRRPTPRVDQGSMALELALVTPVFLVMLLLVVGLGRVAHGRQLVEQAAAAAARAASLTSTSALATSAANTAATNALSQAGVSCRGGGVTVDTSEFHPGGQVSATVRCTADLSGLAMAGFPGSVTLDATAAAPLEPYRDLGTGELSP